MPYPRRVDRPTILGAALELMNEDGLEGVTLRAIAGRLGVRQPGLYHHVASKAALLEALAAELLDRRHTDRLPRHDERWDVFAARNARSLRRAMLSIRDGARLIAAAGSRSPGVDNAIAQLAALERAGFDGPDAALALIAISRYTIGSALEQQTARDGGDIVIDDDRRDAGAAHLVDVARRVVRLGPDHEFEVGLGALLRGLAIRTDRTGVTIGNEASSDDT